MATSTPLQSVRGNEEMRQSMFENHIEATPLRRRSHAPNPVPVLDATNDEMERSNRRSRALLQRRISNIPTASLNESSKSLGEQELKDHFQTCSKLYLENKITPKNAWQLRIIDILKQLAQKTSPDTLQLAGTSLDISAKVYGIRVDDMHSDGLKLASTMARATKRTESEAQEDNDGETGEDAGNINGPLKKKKRRRDLLRGNKNTICKDPKSLKAPLPKLQSAFFCTRTNADSNGVDNLFTNTLRTDHSSYKFPLFTKEPAWVTHPDPVVKDIKTFKSLNVEPINVKLCRPLHDFYVDEWDPEGEEKQLAAEKSLLSQKQDEVVYDENGIPIPELDGSIHDIFEDNANCDPVEDALDADDVQEEILPQIRNEIEHIIDFSPKETGGFQRSEYSYNTVVSTHTGKVIDQIWAGPSHWKLKFLRPSSAKFTGQTTVKTVVKQKKRTVEPERINFLEDISAFDMNNKLKIKKKPPTLDPHKLQLPPPDALCHKIVTNINELLSKPGTCPGKKKDKGIEEKQVDYEVADYQYDNPNDSQYCAQLNDHDSHTDEDMNHKDDPISKEVTQEAHQKFLGQNLIDAPESVPKSYVTYALQAKNMDMKKLKAAIWKILTSVQKETSPHTNSGSISATTVSKVYACLPDLLPEKSRKLLSFPLAFVALLHLCNEHNLYLDPHVDNKDFRIIGDHFN